MQIMNDAFRWSCENGHTETAKWLWGLSMSDGNTPINIHANNEYAFISSCAKWTHRNGEMVVGTFNE